MADNGKIIWDSLIKAGFTEYATAGIMGNLQAESSMDPKRVQGNGYKTADEITCDGETGYGLAQWTYISRQQGLVQFAKTKGRPTGDLMVQIDYLILEIDQYGIKNRLNQFTSAGEAAIFFHRDFENSADTPEQETRRAVYAEEIYNKKGVGCTNLAYNGDTSNYSWGGSIGTGVVGGMPAAANSSPKTSMTGHGKHTDTIFTNPAKTFCEPIYPDLISINTKIPEAISQDVSMQCKTSELIEKGNLSYAIPTSVLSKYGGSAYVNDQASNLLTEQQRKESFDIKKHSKAIKMPSSGKPPNNTDPFPYDAKIEELETHSPRCKIEKIQTCPEAANVARECMQLSTNVEKRIVKLENNLATVLRYLSRISSRVYINCIYWGGVDSAQKYNCIRCLRDDRVSDGQIMSLDQCLTCTRYEPFIGQTYDILNDAGINLAQVLDDCQMSYTTMEDYCKFVKPTEHQNIVETKTLDAASVKTRNSGETDFATEWGPGLAMDWTLYPVEDQHPHINKAQDINGTEYSPLASFQGTGTNSGMMFVPGSSAIENRMVKNKQLMDDVPQDNNN